MKSIFFKIWHSWSNKISSEIQHRRNLQRKWKLKMKGMKIMKDPLLKLRKSSEKKLSKMWWKCSKNFLIIWQSNLADGQMKQKDKNSKSDFHTLTIFNQWKKLWKPFKKTSYLWKWFGNRKKEMESQILTMNKEIKMFLNKH